jgi:hypothetical protein
MNHPNKVQSQPNPGGRSACFWCSCAKLQYPATASSGQENVVELGLRATLAQVKSGGAVRSESKPNTGCTGATVTGGSINEAKQSRHIRVGPSIHDPALRSLGTYSPDFSGTNFSKIRISSKNPQISGLPGSARARSCGTHGLTVSGVAACAGCFRGLRGCLARIRS